MSIEQMIEIAGPSTEECIYIGEKLREKLYGYRIPSDVAARTGIRRMDEVRDRWLIVLCTPEAPRDESVTGAIDRFISDGLYDRILTLLVSGEPKDSFPGRLLFEEKADGSIVEREPLAANIVAGSRRESMRRLDTEKLRLLAPILGVTFDDLMNRRQRTRNRRLVAALAAALTAATVFLGYAFSRMTVINGQNDELGRQLESAEEARSQAVDERNAAQDAYLRTVAVMADTALNQGNSELALLLCLDKEEHISAIPELRAEFEKALRTLCGSGYVPVTDLDYYRQTHPGLTGPEDDTEEMQDVLDPDISFPVPEELDTEKKNQSFRMELNVRQHGYRLYYAAVPLADGKKIYCTLIHFPDAPEKDFYLRSPEGILIDPDYSETIRHGSSLLSKDHYPLADGTLLVRDAKKLYLVDPFAGTVTQVNDTDCLCLMDLEGCGIIAAKISGGIEIYSKEDFKHIYTMEGVSDLIYEGNGGVLLGTDGETVSVYSAETFEKICTIREDEIDESRFGYVYINTVRAAEGRRYLAYGWRVYDLGTGRLIRDFTEMSTGSSTMKNPMISSEGYAFIPGANQIMRIWDLNKDELYLKLDILLAEGAAVPRINYELLGPDTEGFGTGSASAFAANEIVYEYREAVDVPEDLAGQLSLARSLVGERRLTEAERTEWLMED